MNTEPKRERINNPHGYSPFTFEDAAAIVHPVKAKPSRLELIGAQNTAIDDWVVDYTARYDVTRDHAWDLAHDMREAAERIASFLLFENPVLGKNAVQAACDSITDNVDEGSEIFRTTFDLELASAIGEAAA
jgi:hypothetical protein